MGAEIKKIAMHASCVICQGPFSSRGEGVCSRGSCKQELAQRQRRPQQLSRCLLCLLPLPGMGQGEAEVCERPACAKFARQLQMATQNHERIAAWRRRLEQLHQELEDQQRIPPHAARLSVPGHGRKLIPLEAHRIEQLRLHLESLIAELLDPGGASFTEDASESRDLQSEEAASKSGLELSWLQAASCRTCEGFCCLGGGNKGYLCADTLRGLLEGEPDAAAQLLELYLQQLAPEVVEGSCIFHGAEGCVLPPAMRSSTCHRNICPELKQAMEAPPDRPLLILSSSGSTVVRGGWLDEDLGYRRLVVGEGED